MLPKLAPITLLTTAHPLAMGCSAISDTSSLGFFELQLADLRGEELRYLAIFTEKKYIISAISRLLRGKSEFTHSRSMPTVPHAM